MRRIPGYGASLLLAMAIMIPVTITGCSARASGQVKGAHAIIPNDTGTSHAGNNPQLHDGFAQASN
jgi:hypothetical protein